MPYVIGGLLLVAAIFGPQLWVRWVMRRYSRPHERFPGTGGELARHLLDRFGMSDVPVEVTEQGDHYDPQARALRLGRDNHDGRSITAVAVAAHEFGHALQHHHGYAPLAWRTRLAGLAATAQRVGVGAMMALPLLGLVTRSPAVGLLTVLAGLASLGAAAVVHLVTLPVEWDASFGRALPVLKSGNYIDAGEERGVRRVLRAAAMTYVAASLASLLNLGRWLAILRRR